MREAVLPIVDAHQHFWDLRSHPPPWLRDEPPAPFRYGDTRPLRRSYLPADYRRDCGPHRVTATVHVEAEWDPRDPLAEVRWIHALAAAEGLPNAMVAQAWLDRDDAPELLAAEAAFPLVRGVRHKPRAAERPDLVERGAPGSMLDPAFRRGFAELARHGLHFELQTPWWHLAEAVELAGTAPAVPIVLNHAGLPADRSEAGMEGWRGAMAGLAAVPWASVKISGIGVPGRPWTVELQRGVVLDEIEMFGAERCMFASNFPVDLLVADLPTIWDGFLAITAGFAEFDRHRLFGGNARRVYRLGEG